MMRESCVQTGDQLDRRAYVFAVDPIGIEFTLTEVIVHVPHTVARGLGNTPK